MKEKKSSWTQTKSQSSPKPTPSPEKLGSANGSTLLPTNGAELVVPLDSAEELPSFVTTAITTPKGLLAVPTTYVPSTTKTSAPLTASQTMVGEYQLGQPLDLKASILPKLDDLCSGWGSTREVAVAKIYNFLTYGRINWHNRSMEDLVDFYFANFYLSPKA